MTLIRCTLFFYAFLFPLSVSAGDTVNKLNDLFSLQDSSQTDEILDPEIAFRVSADVYSDKQLILNWEIEPGYYLYKNKFSFQSDETGWTLGNADFPMGKLKEDPAFGQVEVYYGQNNVLIPFDLADKSLKYFDLNIAYQGCKEDSVCYPPIKKTLAVVVPASFNTPSVNAVVNQTLLISEQDAITQKLKDKNLLINILTFFGFGFLLALTPCVFPMIPILSGILVGEGDRITRTRAISLSSSYVVAMASTYAVLGIIAGLFSFNLQAASQNVWILSLFSGIFVLLALSMFGFYELHIPSSWQSRLSASQDQSSQGTLKGAAIMGVLSAIIVGPCVAPPLAGALFYISQTGDALLGGLALFAMGLGFGVPLLVVGATSGELLPRAGAWMETIKRIFGVIMLGVAIWFLERVLPETLVLVLWAMLFITTAIFAGALDRLEAVSTYWQRLWKGMCIVTLVYGIVLIVAAANGGGTVLKPFKQQALSSVTTETLPFNYVASLEELDQQLQQAKREGKPVMLDYYADWCVICNELETYTFTDPAVQKTLMQFTLLKIDVTKNNDVDKALLKQFDLFGPPAILFFNKESVEIKSHRLVGFIKAKAFVDHITQAISL
ncbi:MAG: protein-disulfide reductase DsbD [Proteobacteria bacterium]|nr:protein-disulfide reductase DsbD [Pseudomonadota bacterium]